MYSNISERKVALCNLVKDAIRTGITVYAGLPGAENEIGGKTMKKMYLNPELQIAVLEKSDIIVTSPGELGPIDGDSFTPFG